MIHVIAVITARPGQRALLLQRFLANVPTVHAEPGCVEYQAVVDADDAPAFQSACGPDSFIVVEKWRDMQALQAHAQAPHMQAFGASVKDIVAQRRIHVLQPA